MKHNFLLFFGGKWFFPRGGCINILHSFSQNYSSFTYLKIYFCYKNRVSKKTNLAIRLADKSKRRVQYRRYWKALLCSFGILKKKKKHQCTIRGLFQHFFNKFDRFLACSLLNCFSYISKNLKPYQGKIPPESLEKKQRSRSFLSVIIEMKR